MGKERRLTVRLAVKKQLKQYEPIEADISLGETISDKADLQDECNRITDDVLIQVERRLEDLKVRFGEETKSRR